MVDLDDPIEHGKFGRPRFALAETGKTALLDHVYIA